MVTLERARELLRAGNFHEVVGVSPGASREEVHAACRAAQLRTHPDRGGNADLFKVIQDAVEKLRIDENIYVFNGRTPGWAKTQLRSIAEARQGIEVCERSLKAARNRIDAAMTDGDKAKAMGDAARAERGIRNETEILQENLTEFQACYARHVEDERARKEREAAREARLAAAREQQRLLDARADRALQLRKRRGMGNRFPTLPKANTNKAAVDTHMALRREYQSVRQASLKSKRQGRDATELESRAARVMQKAREHVEYWCSLAHEEAGDRLKRFPQLPSKDPRYAKMVGLRKEHARLKVHLRRAKSEEQRASLQDRVDEAFGEAIVLLGTPATNSHN